MSIARIVGVVLLIVGIVLIYMGLVASNSMSEQMSTFFTGRLTQNTTWYLVGGIASAIAGLLLVIGVIGRARQ